MTGNSSAFRHASRSALKGFPCHYWSAKSLSLRPQYCFNGLHDQGLRVATTIILHLLCSLRERLGIDSRRAALAVVVAAQPDRDVLRICDLVADVLIACDL